MISATASIAALIGQVGSDHGRIEILVNNAAILDATPLRRSHHGAISRSDRHQSNGAVEITLAGVPLLRKAEGGRVLNIASIMGVRGSRDPIAYSTAKGGLVNLTRCLACDLASDRITVNAIRRASSIPGWRCCLTARA